MPPPSTATTLRQRRRRLQASEGLERDEVEPLRLDRGLIQDRKRTHVL